MYIVYTKSKCLGVNYTAISPSVTVTMLPRYLRLLAAFILEWLWIHVSMSDPQLFLAVVRRALTLSLGGTSLSKYSPITGIFCSTHCVRPFCNKEAKLFAWSAYLHDITPYFRHFGEELESENPAHGRERARCDPTVSNFLSAMLSQFISSEKDNGADVQLHRPPHTDTVEVCAYSVTIDATAVSLIYLVFGSHRRRRGEEVAGLEIWTDLGPYGDL